MGKFMSNDGGNPLLVPIGGEAGVVEQGCLPVSDQTPVLHGSCVKVWQGNLVCEIIFDKRSDYMMEQITGLHTENK